MSGRGRGFRGRGRGFGTRGGGFNSNGGGDTHSSFGNDNSNGFSNNGGNNGFSNNSGFGNNTGFSNNSNQGGRGGFQRSDDRNHEPSSFSSYNQMDGNQPVQRSRGGGFNNRGRGGGFNQNNRGFDDGNNRGFGQNDGNQGFGNQNSGFGNQDRGFGNQNGGGSGGFGDNKPTGFGNQGSTGFQSRGFGDGGQDKPPPSNYKGHNPELEDLYKNLSVSGINLDKQHDAEVQVKDFELQGKPDEVTVENSRRSTFEEMGLADTLLGNIKRLGWDRPTPVQKYAISTLLAGRDILGCAQTGSGKTGAMLIPVISYLINQGAVNPPYGTPQKPKCIILAPTRELATQIYDDALRLCGNNTGVKPKLLYGGTSTREQMNNIRQGCSILIGTPGRVNDFRQKFVFQMDEVEFFILDEADRMLDMGFRQEIEGIQRELNAPGERTQAFFSATMPNDVQAIAADCLNQYVFLVIGVVGAANENIDQKFFRCEDKKDKFKICGEVVARMNKEKKKILIFVETKVFADTLGGMLGMEPFNIKSTALHGDRSQEDRDRAFSDFKSGKHTVLVATNVAARGIDVNDIGAVINYDMPKECTEYIHRIGRTGRIGHGGEAVTLLTPRKDDHAIPNLINILKDAKKPIPDVLANWGGRGGYSSGTSGFSGGGFNQQPSDHREEANLIREAGQDYAPSKLFSRPYSRPLAHANPPAYAMDSGGRNEEFLSESLRIPFSADVMPESKEWKPENPEEEDW